MKLQEAFLATLEIEFCFESVALFSAGLLSGFSGRVAFAAAAALSA
jgi:hypothetical protein